jgi:AcrR family transcriptional regulator
MESFSMRVLAEDLGVGTMALYTYFRGKEELFRAARERVLADYVPPSGEGPWHEQLREACLAAYHVFTGRPAVLRLLAEASSGDDFADIAMVTMERQLALLRAAGLSRDEAVLANGALLRYTLGSALREVKACTSEDFHATAIRKRLAALSPESHPTLTELGPEMVRFAQDGEAQFRFGLDLVITGLREKVAAAR